MVPLLNSSNFLRLNLTDQPRHELRDQLQSTLGSGYSLERELSSGGMSRVFAATDAVLARRIVVKVLSPELGEGVSAERFAREIRIAASLQQANIVPVLATGETNGLPFYTMPFVEGLSVRERLKRDGAMSIGDAASVMRDVARALAFAHQNGVVHRDIKPENVLLSGDAAVVTDFGIAKAITEARTTSVPGGAPTSLTRTGVSIGTPLYMAPEQISGDEDLDHRADLYSFGCLAYELISGTPPFHGRPGHELMAAHLTLAPAPLTDLRRDCPQVMADIIMRCLEKSPEKRPQSAREILTALDALSTPRGSGRLLKRLAERPALFAVALSTLALAAVALVVVGLFAIAPLSRSANSQSIAILPLANVGGDSAQEYLADGMTDELATAIGKMRGVQVASRSLARRYRGERDLDVREVGRAMGVSFILQGTVRRVGDKLRVAAQLTNANDGVEVWSDSYDRRADEVFSVQDDITRGVATALGLGGGASPGDVRGTADAEAYDLYLRGQFLLRRRGVSQAAQHFERAIARDPNFARAYAALGAALELFPYFVETPAAEVHERATTAARRALQLDSSLAEAHTTLGLALMHAFDWKAAGVAFRTAVEVEPGDAAAHHQYGRYLVYTAQNDSALAEFRRAKAIDPFAALYSIWVAEALFQSKRPAEALQEVRRAIELDSLNPVVNQFAAGVFLANGDSASARSAALRLPGIRPWNGMAANTFARVGDRAAAQRVLAQLRRDGAQWHVETAIAYTALGMGDTTLALAALERATDRREIWPSYMPVPSPVFDPIRGSARFGRLLGRVGIQSYIQAPPPPRF